MNVGQIVPALQPTDLNCAPIRARLAAEPAITSSVGVEALR